MGKRRSRETNSAVVTQEGLDHALLIAIVVPYRNSQHLSSASSEHGAEVHLIWLLTPPGEGRRLAILDHNCLFASSGNPGHEGPDTD